MHVFISDAHIQSDNSLRGKALISFLNEIKAKISDLYILGDLFEFWFEYNIVFPKDYFRILATLYNLIQEGKNIHYVLGNHEVAIGNFLKNFGFIVHPAEVTLKIEGRKVFLAHGNKIDKRLWTLFWEGLLRSKLNHSLYSLIHPDIGVFIAQRIASLSRKQRRSPKLVRMLENYAGKKLKEVDVVMFAHSHMPVFKRLADNKYYINTGDWLEHFTYAALDNNSISLNYYK